MTLPLQFITVRDRDGLVAIGRDDLIRYAGPSEVVASALCLRLFARAFKDLSPDTPPTRNDIKVLVAFPGDGILDCVEMITRARTRGRLTINTEAGPEGVPPSIVGRFYFEVSIAGKAKGYSLGHGFFTDAFVTQIRRHMDGTAAPEEFADYQVAKHALIGRLLGTPDHELFHAHEVMTS